MFDLAKKLSAEITRPYHIACRCGQVETLIAAAANTELDAAKVLVEGGWRWIQAEGGAMCPKCASDSGLD